MIQARTNPGPKVQSDRADARAAELAPILAKLRASGITSSRALAAALTARNIPTRSDAGLGRPQRCAASSRASSDLRMLRPTWGEEPRRCPRPPPPGGNRPPC
jgi:hypothetical protein